MGLTRSTTRQRAGTAGDARRLLETRGLERLLLLSVSALIAFGLFLTYLAKTTSLEQTGGALARQERINLNARPDPEALLPFLSVYPDADDRLFAARRISRFLREDGGRTLRNVGALRTIRVTAAEAAAAPGLDRFSQRAAQLSGSARTMPLLTVTEFERVKEWFVVREPRPFTARLLVWALVYLLTFYLVHGVWSVRGFTGDPLILPCIHFLTGIGFVMMVSLRDPLRDTLLFQNYALGVALGGGAFLLASQVRFTRSVWRRLAYVPLLLSLLLSLVLVVFGSGPQGSDAKVNLALPGVVIQPVEIIKVLLVLFFAGYFAGRWEFMRTLREPRRRIERALSRLTRRGEAVETAAPPAAARLLARLDVPRREDVLPLVVAVGLVLLFFFFQRDLGPALIIACLFLALYGVARARSAAVAAGLLLLVGTFWLAYRVGYPGTVAGRVQIWLSPWDNEVSYGGEHLAHAFWALSAGGLFGTGLGLGDPSRVPQAHTDFILAAIGEELGFVGLAAVLGVFLLLIHRAFRIAFRAGDAYAFFLALSITLLTAFQVLLISSGVLGLLPLSGVISPFLNEGKSSMIASFLLFGMLASLSAGGAERAETLPLRRPARRLVWLVAGVFGLLALKAAWVQVVHPDRTLVRGALVMEADGVKRERINPRILSAARSIPLGTVYDRSGLPIATSSREELERHRDAYSALGIELDQEVPRFSRRYYPIGGAAFNVLGDLTTRRNMGARNTAYVERDEGERLRGYGDVDELVPLVRYRHRPDHPAVRRILARPRDLWLSIDGRLQLEAARILERHARQAGVARAAAVILDPESGEVLASATYPFGEDEEAALLDRPRYGIYPPGSTFKLVTAIAALGKGDDAFGTSYACRPLPGGAAGNFVRGWSRPVRDAVPTVHGSLSLGEALTVSCNAYFAQLGTYYVGAGPLLATLKRFGMHAGLPGEADSTALGRLRDALPQAAIGQGPVLARPLDVARVSALVANGGRLVEPRWSLSPDAAPRPPRLLSPAHADLLGRYMREVVLRGTGRALAGVSVPIAGKTGTAEVQGARPHAWFTGFAPYGAARPGVAFAVILENGGAGGRVAAQAAGDLVLAAAELGLIELEPDAPGARPPPGRAAASRDRPTAPALAAARKP